VSDSSQAIYDAVRSRISNGDIGSAVEAALRDANLSHYAERSANSIQCAAAAYEDAASEYAKPSAIYRPRIYIDGNQWCALYGDNLQDGVAGFGDSPDKAMIDFNKHWTAPLTKAGATC
jgi:hypothetical protein